MTLGTQHPMPETQRKRNPLVLPYPPAILNPNRKAHWAKKSSAAKKYRTDVWAVCKSMGFSSRRFSITFHAPDGRRRDLDNVIAAFKAGQDGLSDAMGVDDSEFRPSHRMGEPWPKRGAVVVEACNG